MSNEEQSVLEFFAQEENLPLALSVAELTDGIRQRMNNAFWHALHGRFAALIKANKLPWAVQLTEDRNTPDNVVGLCLQPLSEQALFLRLMMEQQYMGEALRIYYGVMWSTAPAVEKAGLVEVLALREALRAEGYKNSENFLGWDWSPYHPRKKDFLLRYSMDSNGLLDEAGGLLIHFLLDHGPALNTANAALRDTPRSVTVPLDQLRASIPKAAI